MKKYYLLILLSFTSLLTNAQISSDIDPDYDSKDYLPITSLPQNYVIQNDGKVVIVGDACSYKLYNNQQTTVGNNIMRLKKDLSIDTSFKTGLGFDSTANNIAIQPDGKMLVCGRFKTYNGTQVNNITRLNADGTIDNTFNFNVKGLGFNIFDITQINLIKIQQDGKIMIAGKFEATIFEKFYGRNVLRLNSDGTIDKTFQSSYPYEIFKFELQSDGKIVRVYKNTYNKEASYKIDRLNSDGTTDLSFNAIEGFGGICSSNTVGYSGMSDCRLAIQNDGKILFGGCFTSFKYLDTRGFMRFNQDGTKDLSFEYVYPGYPRATVKDFILLPNNKILTNDLMLINSDGSIENKNIAKLDKDTNSNKIMLYPNNNELLICSENTINSPGGKVSYFGKFIKLDLTTSEVNMQQQAATFYSGNDILEKPNGDIVVLGYSKNSYNTKYHDGIKLLDKNGNLVYNNNLRSNLFSPVQSEKDYFEKGIVQPDGKIIVFKNVYSKSSGLVRYNADFSIDNSFSAPILGSIYSMILLQDGKILIVSDNYQSGLTRLNTDGSEDSTFTNITGFNKQCYTAIIQPDGKILVGGNFTSYKEVKAHLLARFNNDGTLDNTFHTDENLQGYFITSLGLQSDGKIIIGGMGFIDENNYETGSVIKRLNSDGSTDESFITYRSTFVSHYTKEILVSPDNKILFYTRLNSNTEYSKNDFKRLESNGEIDNTFDTGEAFNGNINSMKVQKDGSLLLTGNFTKYKDTWCNGTIRLLGNKNTLDTPNFSLINNNDDSHFILFPNPTKNILNISSKENITIESIQIYNNLGKCVLDLKNQKTFSNTDVSRLAKGVYFIKINSNKKITTNKFIKN